MKDLLKRCVGRVTTVTVISYVQRMDMSVLTSVSGLTKVNMMKSIQRGSEQLCQLMEEQLQECDGSKHFK